MRKKLLILLIFISGTFLLNAQITITPQVPPTGALMKKQLWNVLIVSSGEYSAATINLTLADVVTGEPVLTASVTGIALSAGSNSFDASSLPQIIYDYPSPDFTDHNPDGFLLVGSYNACYALSYGVHNTPVTICVPVIVEPVSPPMLNTPFNEEIVQAHTPQFIWIPPMPTEIYSYLNYDFKLVEVAPEQNPVDAIEQNLPIYNTNQTDPYLSYPGSANLLDTGKLYAWQIIANNRDVYTSKSEVWTFTIATLPPLPGKTIANNFLKLKKFLDGSVGSAIGELNAFYANDAADTSVQYQIFDISAAQNGKDTYRKIKFGQIDLTTGQNTITIPFSSLDALESGKSYLFQLINSRHEKWSVKFIYFKKDQ